MRKAPGRMRDLTLKYSPETAGFLNVNSILFCVLNHLARMMFNLVKAILIGFLKMF